MFSVDGDLDQRRARERITQDHIVDGVGEEAGHPCTRLEPAGQFHRGTGDPLEKLTIAEHRFGRRRDEDRAIETELPRPVEQIGDCPLGEVLQRQRAALGLGGHDRTLIFRKFGDQHAQLFHIGDPQRPPVLGDEALAFKP